MPRAQSPLAEALAAVAGALGHLRVRWYVFGAQAAIVHGSARLSADLDVTVELAGISIDRLVDALAAAGCVPQVDDAAQFLAEARVLPLVHRKSRFPIDLVLSGLGLEGRYLASARVHTIGGVRAPVAPPEGLVVMKILAGRPQDLDDVRAILAAKGKSLALAQVRVELTELEEALDRSDLVPTLDRLLKDAVAPRRKRAPTASRTRRRTKT